MLRAEGRIDEGTYSVGEANADFLANQSHYGKHCNAAMLQLGLAHPVDICAQLFDVGQSKGIKASISRLK